MHSQPKALIFDFDGVLADTEPLYWKTWATLLAPYNIRFSWEDYCTFGRGVRDEHMLGRLPQLASEPAIVSGLMEQREERREMIRKWCVQQSPIGLPTIQMLNSLKEFRIGLVTSSDRAHVEPILRTAEIYQCFHAFVFAENIRRHKPDPEPYLLIQERLGIRTGIAFEDSDVGIASATHAGLMAIRVEEPSNLPKIVEKSLHLYS